MIVDYRLLAVIAHPDDEAFAFGGLLALASTHGANVRVLCLTYGENGSDRRGVATTPDALGRVRGEELRRSCEALGVPPPVFSGLADGTLATTSLARVKSCILEEVNRFVPHVIVGLGYDGAYGHADHIAVAMSIRDAVEESPGRRTRVLHSAFPSGLFQPVCERLMRIPNSPIPPRFDPLTLGCGRRKVDLRMDISAVRHHKLAAIASHASQLHNGDPHSFLIPGIVDTLMSEEWYTLEMGPAMPKGATNPFAGI